MDRSRPARAYVTSGVGVRRLAALALAGVITVSGMGTSPVSADESGERSPNETPQLPGDGGVDHDPRVAYLVDEYGISTAEATSRISGQRTIARTSAILGRDYPESLGGIWVDHAGGGKLVLRAVARDQDLVGRARQLLGAWADDLSAVPARHNLTELRAAHRAMLHARDALMSMGAGNIGMRIDIPTNHW